MGLISPPQLSDNTTHTAADHNNPINTIANEFNGNIDNTNIKAGAAIDVSKLAQNNGQLAIKPVIAYKFNVYLVAAINVGTADTLVQFDTKNYDTSSNVDIVTHKGRFTAPVSGFYQFNTNILTNTAGSGTSVYTFLYKNGARICILSAQITGAGVNPGGGGGTLLQLAATDYIEVYVATGVAAKALDVSAAYNNTFSGFLVSV